MKNKTINVKGIEITIVRQNEMDYISLTDMLKAKDGDFFISDWLRNRNTVEFLGIWESVYNPDFSAEFKIYLIKEFQRLKEEENSRLKMEWNLQRTLAKVNYIIHTDAIKENLIPKELTKQQVNFVYASEADILNMALFGMTAKEWREANPKVDGNVRDTASIEQLVVLSNLESINAVLIHQGLPQPERLKQLNTIAITQMKSLVGNKHLKKLK